MWKLIIGAAIGGFVAAMTSVILQRWRFHLYPLGLTYAELAATLLAAAALILAALGFFIAVLAVFGLSQFRGLVKRSATDSARSHVNARLQDGDLHKQVEEVLSSYLDRQFEAGKLRALIERRVDYVIYSGVKDRASSPEEENREE